MESSIHTNLNHLFRREYGKLIASLTKTFGTHNLALVEDVVQDTLLKALETWKLKGIPDNPSAWLFTVARNKALDLIRRQKHQQAFAAQLTPLLKSEYTAAATLQEIVKDGNIEDEQLRMMFVCCHPLLAEETQVALILKTLCGFSIAEIASAFLTSEETISKRLFRGREKFREEKITFDLPVEKELPERLESVLTAIYLLFNEGYHATHVAGIIRDDLVEEALRLGNLLRYNTSTDTTATKALLALMCFHAARLYQRIDENGSLLALKDQDRTKWNHALIVQGHYFLKLASSGESITAYHLEAAIAYEYSVAPSYELTNWKQIDELYKSLLKLKPLPLLEFQHTIVKAECYGYAQGLDELLRLEASGLFSRNHFFYTTKGEWLSKLNQKKEAEESLLKASELAHTKAEKNFILKKIVSLGY
ncbi:sigma-70 family RNA polymerase sigma factor [Chryseotalea sanaruensis]|uniref:RNA polymerase sigma factor n=1 Tax=Chryseotalea sanaruensis TaxID=2482724 RepID=A0A401UBL1_9BACT|nr:sigma-70 family RNA polymerase sigma factor [Chryseotalea sanaruensis]GCC52281.1 sigma-70 family RNA polymerase sigma factor [Chryseotalea sanaruensis]